MRRFLFIILSIVLMASCRSTKKIQTAISKKDTSAKVVLQGVKEDSLQYFRKMVSDINANRIQYNTFTSKVNIDYEGNDGKKYNINANIRMYKDSAIWISANALLGIEAMRVLITRDSVKLLNKLEKTYMLTPM